MGPPEVNMTVDPPRSEHRSGPPQSEHGSGPPEVDAEEVVEEDQLGKWVVCLRKKAFLLEFITHITKVLQSDKTL